jgi:acyl-CoA thioester hydrolase
MSPSYVHYERVRFGDLDAMRHLNNVVFLRYFETARIAFLRQIFPTHNPSSPEAEGFGLIFAECRIRYRAPVMFDEVVAITCSIGEVRRSAFEVVFEMHVEDKLVAEGAGWLVGYDYSRETSMPLPAGLREALSSELPGTSRPQGEAPQAPAAP